MGEEHHVQQDLLEQFQADMEIVPGKAVGVGPVKGDPRAGGVYGILPSLPGLVYMTTPFVNMIFLDIEQPLIFSLLL